MATYRCSVCHAQTSTPHKPAKKLRFCKACIAKLGSHKKAAATAKKGKA